MDGRGPEEMASELGSVETSVSKMKVALDQPTKCGKAGYAATRWKVQAKVKVVQETPKVAIKEEQNIRSCRALTLGITTIEEHSIRSNNTELPFQLSIGIHQSVQSAVA